jgi:DNA polymerase III delta subunit
VITTLTGENGFSLGEKLRQMVDSFVVQYGNLTLERLDGEEADVATIQQALTSIPFLATQQLVVLQTPGKNKQFTQLFEQLLNETPATTDVIIVEPKLDKRLSYYKFLKNHTDFQEFLELDYNSLARWLTTTTKTQGGSLGASDARYLVDRVGINQQLLAHELDKLLLYNPQISHETIDLLTDPIPQSTIFQLLEAAFTGHSNNVLDLYAQQRALKVEPQQMIAMLTWQLHVVSIIKTADDDLAVEQIAKEASISPYVIRKSQTIANNLSLANLKKYVADLETIDKRMKRTLIDPDEALTHYLLNLTI